MNYTIIFPIITLFIIATLGVIVLISNSKDNRHRVLFFILLLSSFWIASSFLADHSNTQTATLFWTKFAIIPPALVLPLLLYFSLIFPISIKKLKWNELLYLFIPAIFYLIFSGSSFNIENVMIKSWGAEYTPGILYKIFIPYFIIYFGATFYNFYKSYRKGDRVAKAQIKFVVLGLFGAFIIGIISNVILPLLGNSTVSVLGPSLSILILGGLNTFAILKHHLFNIKVIAAELLTFVIWLFLLIQILVSDSTQAKAVNGTLLLLVIFFGILLMKSVIGEVRQRERLQIVSNELEKANEKLKGQDKLKTEFLGFASHQVRSPLSGIKNAASMLLEGSYGKITNDRQYTQIDQILNSSNNLIKVIEDLLDVSKIEQGGMKYEMQQVEIKKLIENIVNEFSASAKNKGLALSIEEKDEGEYIVKADPLKIRQVFLNLIDNSMKYTRIGFVKILLSKPDIGKVRIAVTDSGIGISANNISNLFEKFSRGEGGKVNVGGSGLGLYLAKEIIISHGGKIWAESLGAGKGSTFKIELLS